MSLRRVIACAAVLVCGTAPGVWAADAAGAIVDAVRTGNRQTVRALVKQRVNVNAPEVDGTTALDWAVRADDLETVRLLIHGGADVNAPNRYGVTPLSLAATNGSAEVTAALLEAGADSNVVTPAPGSVIGV